MAENMIKFLRGNVANLPQTATPGALYFTKDEGVYLGLDNGSYHRYGDFITVADVNSLPATGAHATCMYYCTSENILARYDSVKGWIQINKQPTAEELKGLLGLGSLAYLSEVAEANLNADLAAKINDAYGVRHSHDNKTVLDGITAEKVAAWDAAEGNAKSYTDGKDSAMNTRVEALETAIGENGSVATQIKTAIEALDYTDTAVDGEYVSAVNEVDGKISVTRKALPDYSNTYDAKGAAATALDNAKAYADGLAANYDEKGAAAGVKTELTAEINKKVDKVEGKDLIATSEIERLAGVSDGANKVEASANNGSIKIDGVETVVYTHPEKHAIADVDGLQAALDGKQAAGDYATKTEVNNVDAKFADYVTSASYATDKAATESALADRYTKSEADAKFALAEDAYDDDEVRGLISDNAESIGTLAGKVGEVPEGQTVMGIITNIQENAYDDTELRGLIGDNADAIDAIEADYLKAADKTELSDAIAAEKERAEGIEGGLETRLAAVEGDYLKASDKEDLQTQINTIMNNPDAEGAINSINEFTQYVADHGTIADGMRVDINKNKEDIAANAKAIEDESGRADAAEKALAGRLDVLEAIDHEAYKDYADGKADAAKEAAIADAASKYETKGTAQGIVDGLKLSETYEPIGAEGRAIAAAKTETENQVNALAGNVYSKTETYTQSEIEALLTWGSF